jgi:drug/metabolite transporter (DMT)-like permease
MKKQKNISIITLVLMTFIWGGTFPMIKVLLSSLHPLELLAFRFLFASVAGFPFFIKQAYKYRKSLLKLALLGAIMWIAYYTQTIGLQYTTTSKSAFITGLYIIFTPIFALTLIREKMSINLVLALIIALAGLLVLSGVTLHEFSFNKGDLITIVSAVAFAIQIVLTNIYVKDIDMKLITSVQMITMCLLSFAFAGNKISFAHPLYVYAVLAFLGVVAGFIAILIETYSLKYLDPDRASIIFTLEPVFAYLSSIVFLHEAVTIRGITGALLIIGSMLIATLNGKNKQVKN